MSLRGVGVSNQVVHWCDSPPSTTSRLDSLAPTTEFPVSSPQELVFRDSGHVADVEYEGVVKT